MCHDSAESAASRRKQNPHIAMREVEVASAAWRVTPDIGVKAPPSLTLALKAGTNGELTPDIGVDSPEARASKV